MLSDRAVVQVALGGVVAIVLTACGGDDNSSTAATVNGTDIAASDVDAQAELLSDNPQIQQQYEGADEEQTEQQLRADVLNQYIFELVLRDGAEELGVEVTADDIDETRAEIAAQFGGDEEAMYTQLEQQGTDREEIDRQVEVIALQEAVVAALGPGVSDEEIQQAYEDGAPARHVLVEDEERANEVRDRIEGGESFADVAADASTDGTAQQGGDLGFVQPGATVPAFEEALFAAEEGELVGPVQTDFGFHVLQRLEKPALEEVEQELRSQLEQQTQQEGQAALQEFISQRLEEAEVEVNSDYGAWDAEMSQVVPENPIQPPQPEQPLPEQPEQGGDGEDAEATENGDGSQTGGEE